MTAAELAARLDARKNGAGWAAKCPAHDDGRASLSISEGRDGLALLYCHAGCPTETVLNAIGLDLKSIMSGNGQPSKAASNGRVSITVAQLAEDKGLPLEALTGHDVKDLLGGGVLIPYYREDGTEAPRHRLRYALAAKDGSKWTKGDGPIVPYGLSRLAEARKAGLLFITEGESDCWTLHLAGFPALGIPGAAMVKALKAEHVRGISSAYIMQDRDSAGEAFVGEMRALLASLSVAYVYTVRMPAGCKDPNDLYRKDRSGFKAAFTRLLADAETGAARLETARISEPQRAMPEPLAPDVRDEHERRVLSEAARERAKREARRRIDGEERGAIALPEFDTLRNRLSRPVPVTHWRIENWQPREARVMLAAQFKAGKTTLIGNLLRSLVDGDSWLGRDRVEPIDGTVVLFDFEMAPAQLDAWLRVQHIRGDDRVLPVPMRGAASSFNLLDDKIRAQWAERLRACGAAYVVLDCLRPVLDALGLDEHSEAGRFLVAFDALLKEAGIPEACIVHHMGHNGERSRGDSRLRDWPDAEWRLVRRGDDPASGRYITAYGRDVDLPESELVYDSDTRRLTIAGGSRRDAASREALTAILAEIGDRELSGRAITGEFKESDYPRDTIAEAVKLGAQTGELIVRPGPKNSKLYRRSGLVSGVSGQCPADTESQCPGAYISPDTRTLADAVVSSDDGRTLETGSGERSMMADEKSAQFVGLGVR